VEAQTLQLLVNDKRVVSDAPVVITRGADRFTADRMAINQQNGTTELTGRVRGVLLPSASRR
jgi:lipopolysaccharide export system protein LptC